MVLFDPDSDIQTITRACRMQAQSAVKYEKHGQFMPLDSTECPVQINVMASLLSANYGLSQK